MNLEHTNIKSILSETLVFYDSAWVYSYQLLNVNRRLLAVQVIHDTFIKLILKILKCSKFCFLITFNRLF